MCVCPRGSLTLPQSWSTYLFLHPLWYVDLCPSCLVPRTQCPAHSSHPNILWTNETNKSLNENTESIVTFKKVTSTSEHTCRDDVNRPSKPAPSRCVSQLLLIPFYCRRVQWSECSGKRVTDKGALSSQCTAGGAHGLCFNTVPCLEVPDINLPAFPHATVFTRPHARWLTAPREAAGCYLNCNGVLLSTGLLTRKIC